MNLKIWFNFNSIFLCYPGSIPNFNYWMCVKLKSIFNNLHQVSFRIKNIYKQSQLHSNLFHSVISFIPTIFSQFRTFPKTTMGTFSCFFMIRISSTSSTMYVQKLTFFSVRCCSFSHFLNLFFISKKKQKSNVNKS